MRSHLDLPLIANVKNLSELVIYPVISTEYFSIAMNDVFFKKLLLLNIALLMCTEDELSMLLGRISESCIQLKTLKLDIHMLKADNKTKKVTQMMENPPVVKLTLNKLNL
jgi:hypothetical protein